MLTMSLDCVRIVSFLPQLQNALCEPSLGSRGLMPPWSTCHAMNIMCIKKDTSTCWAFEAPCSRELLGPKLIHVQYVVGRMLQANWGTCCMQKQEQTSPHHVQYKYYFQAQYTGALIFEPCLIEHPSYSNKIHLGQTELNWYLVKKLW